MQMFLSYLNLLSLGIVLYCIYVLQPLGCKQAINVVIIIIIILFSLVGFPWLPVSIYAGLKASMADER